MRLTKTYCCRTRCAMAAVAHATGPSTPAMMVNARVDGCTAGVFSSRKIVSKRHEDMAFRVLAAGNFPKHRSLSDLRNPSVHSADLLTRNQRTPLLHKNTGRRHWAALNQSAAQTPRAQPPL